MPSASVESALILAASGRKPEAILLLNGACAQGDAEALFTKGVWRLTGDIIPRDLAQSRKLFGDAAAQGHAVARRVYTAFLANGTGGEADWPAALRLLSERSKGEPDAAREMRLINMMAVGANGEPVWLPDPRELSDSPRVTLFPGLFTPAECRFLIAVADPLMQPAVIVHPQTGKHIANPIRTSDSAALPFADESPAIHALNRRIANASATHVSHGEPLQILRYRPGQQYRSHSDALPQGGNQRVLTMLVYLNEDYGGGETHFFANGLSVSGKTGDGLLFRNVTADGRPDPKATHAGNPVIKGTKFIASRWIREKPLSLERPAP
jgi:prolyl 4-hydroxylase